MENTNRQPEDNKREKTLAEDEERKEAARSWLADYIRSIQSSVNNVPKDNKQKKDV